MTRTFTSSPIWTWKCDSCGRETALARVQSALPTPAFMRAEGWYIAPRFGDKCPQCVAKEAE